MHTTSSVNIEMQNPKFQNSAVFFDEILNDPVSQLHRVGLYFADVVFEDAPGFEKKPQ